MKKHKVLITITIVIVIILGILPGLLTLFEKTDVQFWKYIVTCISSILVGILIGYFISQYLLRILFKTAKSLVDKSIIILFITFISGIITLMVAWETILIVPWLFGWEYTGEFNPWENFLDHYLLMLMYGSIPVGIISILNGLFSFIYLKLTK